MPPTLIVANTDSLGEQVQRAFPDAKVVKSLTTVFCEVMVDPSRIPGEHSIFLAGDDAEAKQTVRGILNGFGWPAASVVDLGDITGARAVEMYSRLNLALGGALGTFELTSTSSAHRRERRFSGMSTLKNNELLVTTTCPRTTMVRSNYLDPPDVRAKI